MSQSSIRWAWLVGLLAALTGCAQEVGDIDRTDPNRIEKAAFEGEWFFRQTVVGVNGSALTSFVGLEGQLERIEFEVQEDHLLAYRTHEDIPGLDSGSLPDGVAFEHGQPVVAFPISSHFDIQRQYNSSTGEQTNVIVENTSDRHWYDREYIRVNWTENEVVVAWDFMIDITGVANVSIPPQDQGDNPTWFVERNEEGEVVYIDTLTTFIIEPDWIECILTFGWPLYGGLCGPETVTVRSSFARIEADSDYVPREYSDFDMNDFGFFRTERATYDRGYETRDQNRIYLANTWNMWETNRAADGSVLPYSERTPGQIVYYLSPNFPERLKPVAFEVAQDYDNAFRRIVATYRGVAVPEDPRDMAEVPYDQVPRVFYLCDNPGGTDGAFEVSNEGYASGICQRPGQTKNLGDLRFSYFAWVDNPQQSGPAGYGPSGADPLTGEIVSGNAYIYGAYMDYYAQFTLDMAKLITGELDEVDYGYGRYMEEYFDRLRQEADGDLFFGLAEESRERVEHLRGAIDRVLTQPRVQTILDMDLEEFRLRNEAQVSPFERLRGTELERLALFPEVQRHLMSPEYMEGVASGEIDPSAPLSDEQLDAVSIATMGDPVRMLRDANRRAARYMQHGPQDACVYMGNLDDPTMLGMARELAAEREQLSAQGMSAAEIDALQFQRIQDGAMREILAHEVGHTVGLRHNFEGSYDALNYGRDYWDLRERTFDTCDPNLVTFAADGMMSGQIAPPLCEGNETPAEYAQRNAALLEELTNSRMFDHQYSTVMDYLPKASMAWNGLGHYDYAALAYGYGELREVFDSTPSQLYVEVNYDPATDDYTSSTVRRSQHDLQTFDDLDEYFIRRRNQVEGDDPAYLREDEIEHEHSYRYYHYSTLPVIFGGDVAAMYDRSLVPASQVGSQVVVPYRFCSDEYNGASIECNVWDHGADFTEIYNNIQTSWDEYYVINFFRRGRAGYGLYLYPLLSRMYSRTMAPMTRLYQHWLIRAQRGTAWYNSWWGGEDATLAMMAGVDFLGNVVTAPTVGTYYYDEGEDLFVNISEDLGYQAPFNFEVDENINPSSDYIDIGLDVGRYGFEQFRRNEDDEGGYYYFMETEVLSWFWAKWAAMMALTLPEVEVIGVDASSDSTAFSIPIYLIFDQEMTSFFGALPREDFDVLSSCVEMNGSRTPERILQRNLASGAPTACAGSERLNPYTDIYGNSDFNLRLLSILYAAAYFQSNYSANWFDQSNVYILGRGYNLEPAPGHTLVVYEHHNGVQYAAMVPETFDADQDEDVFVGYQIVNRAQELRDARDAEALANGETDLYWELHFQLEGLLEDTRLLNQANQLFEGYNVFLPGAL